MRSGKQSNNDDLLGISVSSCLDTRSEHRDSVSVNLKLSFECPDYNLLPVPNRQHNLLKMIFPILDGLCLQKPTTCKISKQYVVFGISFKFWFLWAMVFWSEGDFGWNARCKLHPPFEKNMKTTRPELF